MERLKKTINHLLDLKKPLHPTDLERVGLKYMCKSHSYQWYKNEEYFFAFNENKEIPLLDFYARFNNKK